MSLQHLKNIIFLAIIFALAACDSKPRVIESEPVSNVTPTSIPSLNETPVATHVPISSEEHKVTVEEVLHTEKYTYLNVDEGGKKYWVATSKMDAHEGDTYFYTGGLLKKNFFSKEFNRVFETVYLVSKIWKQPPAGGSGSALDEALAKTQGGKSVDLKVGNIEPAAGATKISDLISNKEKYNGKVVKVTGKCVKVNPMIMGRNWVHLQDGSGENIDLTITTAENIPLGSVVNLEGTIALDKDFGAGYRYDIIMEGAVFF